MGSTAEQRRPGRPRSPEVEIRALNAARSLYSERGWSGFSLEQVAKRSGIGKGSLYLRWSDRGALLIDAVRREAEFIGEIDTGSLRGDLIEFATLWMRHLESDQGALSQRLVIDAQFHPELRDALARDPYPRHIRATRALVRRGIERSEVPGNSSPALMADLITGAVSNHIRSTPQDMRRNVRTTEYIARLVDTVLAGTRSLEQ